MGRQIPQDLQISAAHSGGLDLDQHLVGTGLGIGSLPAAISSTAVMVTALAWVQSAAPVVGSRVRRASIQTSTAAPYARAMEQFLSRRGLLAGGGASSAGGLLLRVDIHFSKCFWHSRPLRRGRSEPLVPFAPFAAPVFNDKPLRTRCSRGTTAEIGEVLH